MKQQLRSWIFRLLRKDPEAVVVTFSTTGDPAFTSLMSPEVRDLLADREHYIVGAQIEGAARLDLTPGSPWNLCRQLRAHLRHKFRLAPAAPRRLSPRPAQDPRL